MKTIGIVNKLTAMAEARASYNGETGTATENRKVVGGYKYDEPQEVYRVEFTRTSGYDIIELFHHETKTLSLSLGFGDDKHITHVYGESRSDADSINTLLERSYIGNRYTYRPVNGGFMEVENDEEE